MAKESDQFVCPCCGQHAPVERLEDPTPFDFALWHKIMHGKVKLSTAEREARKGQSFGRGSAPGNIEYYEVEPTADILEKLKDRIQLLFDRYGT